MKLKLLFFFLLITTITNAQIYVDKDATGTADGSSWANAFTDLKTALSNVKNGSNIWVADGVYSPGTNKTDAFILNKANVTIYGGFNGTETQLSQRDFNQFKTILSGDVNNDDTGVAYFGVNRSDNNYTVVRVESNLCTVDGVTITAGHADGSGGSLTNQGSAIFINRDSFTIRNTKITKNVVSGSGVVRMLDRQGFLKVENSIFEENFGNGGVNIYTRALGGNLEVSIINSLFTNNTLEAASGSGDKGLFWFRQDVFATQNITIINSTFANNKNKTKAGTASIINVNKNGNGSINVKVFNAIFWGNKTSDNNVLRAVGNDQAGFNAANSYQIETTITEDGLANLTHNGTTIINVNNSSDNPLFKSATDFTLQGNSIALNVGDNSKTPTDLQTDLLGNMRIQANKVDLGCYESSSTIKNAPFNVTYVDKNATGNNDGSSWANALTDFQTALTNTDDTKIIWVAKGVYKPTIGGGGRFNKFTINKDFTTIYGGFAGTEKDPSERNIAANPTIISGDVNDDDTGTDFSGVNRTDNLYQLFVIETYNVTIDGFTLASGTADVNSGTGLNPRGEGAAVTIIPRNWNIKINFTLRNSIVEKNLCKRGGVIRVIDKLGNINIENTIFRNNLAEFGTVLYTRAHVDTNGRLFTKITNSLFESNKLAKTSGIAGGGIMYFRGAQISKQIVTIANSTFVDNDNASSGKLNATLINTESGIEVKAYNSIFWNNKNANNQILKTVGNDLTTGSAIFTASNSLADDATFDTSTGTGNINSDPLFTSTTDFTLQATSPAINAGDNSKVPSNTLLDLAGETRIFGAAVDMGAYESKVVGVAKRTLVITSTNGSVTSNPNPVNGTYNDGALVTLTATPDTGYQFDGFRDDDTGANLALNSGNSLSTSITMNSDKNITANFIKIQRKLTIISMNGTVVATTTPVNTNKSGDYDDGTIVTLTATPDANFAFVNWSGDIKGKSTTITVTMDADKTVTANFSSTLSINDDILSKNALKLYPNPTNNFINISTDKVIRTVSIYNILGRKVMETSKSKIDVSNLKAGIYLLSLETEEGKRSTKKFMKK
ncbi:choice-of-anchor Q domain-containing protein [uncultured Polaribacter sp.]|uniref:InlB B-repeat-containing protein n=1 Tax=uncultured Polaribacter sp. TaxID=174711 RepID=UPI00262E8851|nr:choice-of-anchor Q domain-containing protein [uncultured Polaribacter sp.]